VTGKGRSKASMDNQPAKKKLVRKYRSQEEDLKWASRGLVGTVINGESMSLIQSRVEDVGFNDINIIPLGVDKVFIHSLSGMDVSDTVWKEKQFFDLLFSRIICWDKAVLPFQRGAWLRVYGISIHAWNEIFSNCVS